ncbi:Ankyrin repeat protein 2 [Giardia muris]|uniref:Ankyrin repeat protein 2 n=1 Tax=Giardia muris TaxID=5742 RepID=A0A4Z1TC80_GIAMU|nr:Ankyrin repeat protein 2 [Giardia muris]|eukprot:TNJ30081.1 Ankyrin repeat protein 2 [Giardia muris]
MASSELMDAAFIGDVPAVKENLRQACRKDMLGQTALMKAAERGNFDCVCLLVEKEGRMVNNYQETALMYAAGSGKTDCVEILAAAEAGMQDKHGWTALMRATREGHLDAVKLLAQKESGMQLASWYHDMPPGTTALMIAVAKEFTDIVEVLLPYEIMMQDSKRRPALWYAIKKNFIMISNMLEREAVLMTDVFGASQVVISPVAEHTSPLNGIAPEVPPEMLFQNLSEAPAHSVSAPHAIIEPTGITTTEEPEEIPRDYPETGMDAPLPMAQKYSDEQFNDTIDTASTVQDIDQILSQTALLDAWATEQMNAYCEYPNVGGCVGKIKGELAVIMDELRGLKITLRGPTSNTPCETVEILKTQVENLKDACRKQETELTAMVDQNAQLQSILIQKDEYIAQLEVELASLKAQSVAAVSRRLVLPTLEELEQYSTTDLQDLNSNLPELQRMVNEAVINKSNMPLCLSCNASIRSVLIQPCGHLCICESCQKSNEIATCPSCGSPAQGFLKVHM